jgi:hypothetical protein
MWVGMCVMCRGKNLGNRWLGLEWTSPESPALWHLEAFAITQYVHRHGRCPAARIPSDFEKQTKKNPTLASKHSFLLF